MSIFMKVSYGQGFHSSFDNLLVSDHNIFYFR